MLFLEKSNNLIFFLYVPNGSLYKTKNLDNQKNIKVFFVAGAGLEPTTFGL